MTRKLGIDISVWQGNVNFKEVKKTSVEFVVLREGYGKQTIDRNFLKYARECMEINLPVIGVYHFSYARTVQDAIQEAKSCIKNVLTAGLIGRNSLKQDFTIFYDFEYDTVDNAANAGVKLTKADCRAFTTAFCDEVTSSGFKTGVYANIDYYKNWYGADFFKKYPLWLADWSGGADYPCVLHQYSSVGKIEGIDGNVDMNYMEVAEQIVPPLQNGSKTVEDIAEEVLQGKWGNGEERKKALTSAGYVYAEVQKKVNELLNKKTPPLKSIDEIAKEVLQGKWSNGSERKHRLTEAGYDANKVQVRVNELLK